MRLSATVLVLGMLAACGGGEEGAGSESMHTDPIPLPTEELPPLRPVPFSFVWSAEAGIDLDSRPMEIARAYAESRFYLNAGVDLDRGYPGFYDFTGEERDPRIHPDQPPTIGMGRFHVAEVASVPDEIGTRYRVTLCYASSEAAAWDRYMARWKRGRGPQGEDVFFSLPGPPRSWTAPGGGEPIDTADRDQIPSWNVFEGAVFRPVYRDFYIEDRAARFPDVSRKCRDAFPELEAGEFLDGPLPAQPWYPGWPRGGKGATG